jgi:spore germination cell wall hydrolase CwlJ-like protein
MRTGRVIQVLVTPKIGSGLALRRGIGAVGGTPSNVTSLPENMNPAGGAAAGERKVAAADLRNRQLMCMATAIYFEARGEPELGQVAVAQVIQNRVEHEFYPNTICGVVFQNQHWRNRCQFSFACDGKSDRPRSAGAWSQAIRVAKKFMLGKAYVKNVGKSTHYHANYVRPRWVRDMIRRDRIGKHIFYTVRGWS